MKTSNFAASGSNIKAVAISRTTPSWYKGRRYIRLAPPYTLLGKWNREEIEPDEYTEVYYGKVLDLLDPKQVIRDLGEDSILLCWCAKGDFCHRRLVADWLTSSFGEEISEIPPRKPRSKPPESHSLDEYT